VNKEQLFDLTERVKLVAGVELPVIVGSQSLYAVTSQVPDIVKRSVECDFLLLAVGPPVFRAVIEQIGFARCQGAARGGGRAGAAQQRVQAVSNSRVGCIERGMGLDAR